MARIFILLFLFTSLGINAQVTFHKDIAPILKKHCTSCHAQNEIGPMPLVTYEEVSSYAAMIKFVTNITLMPPFKADYHKVKYKNERSISKDEIATIEAWIDQGLLKGDPVEAVLERKKVDTTFDQIICMEEAFEHYGIYYDQYQAFVLPLNLSEDKFVSDVEVFPGNKEIVRSAYLSVSNEGDAAKMDEWDPKYGFYAYGSLGFEPSLPNWHSWIANTDGLGTNENEYMFLPKDTELVLHLHYGPYGEIQMDSTCIGINYAENIKGKDQLQNVPLIATEFLKDSFFLESNLKKRISSQFYIPEDIHIKSITPLAHLLCTDWEVFAVFPDKSSRPLLSISDWDFHWRERYVFKDYIFLPKGTRIVCTATYDNTSNNPYNPSDPPHNMKKGPHMYDENHLCYFELIHQKPNRKITIKKPSTNLQSKLLNLEFSCTEAGTYKITAHNLTDNNVLLLSEKTYSKGIHVLRGNEFFATPGQYSISISNENEVQDVWVFVRK